MTNKALSVAVRVLSVVCALALLGGVISFVYKYTDGFNDGFKTFYIEYNGKQILTETSALTFDAGAIHKFTVKYTFDGSDRPRGYSVKIAANPNTEFEYTVNGDVYLFSALDGLTDVFGMEKQATAFTLYFGSEDNIHNVLRKVYGTDNVTVPDSAVQSEYPYRLVVSSYNDKVTYNIDFGISGTDDPDVPTADKYGITLDHSEIVF